MLTDLAATTKHYTPIPLYPAVVEDLTLKYPPRTYIGPIISQIYKETKLVKKVEVLDNYKDSITLRITYRDDKRNLKNSEIKTIRQQILQTLKSKYQISLK
jgi:phenylalanyl-tRNA synthetase beta subunit